MGRACSTNGEKRNAYRIMVGKSAEKMDNTKTDLRQDGVV
jgi:hypothetical protein